MPRSRAANIRGLVSKRIKEGRTDQEIIRALTGQGHSLQEVNKLILELRSKKKKYAAPLMMAVALLVILVITTMYIIVQKLPIAVLPQGKNSLQACDEKSGDERSDCYLRLAIQTKKPGICSNIEASNFQDRCYMATAKKVRVAKICARITNSSISDKCYTAIATKTRNPEICENIIDPVIYSKCTS